MADAYPLQWPIGRARWSGLRERNGTFKMADSAKVNHLLDELDRLGARDVVISTNRAPFSRANKMSDPGVAVYFKRKGKELCIACDKWDKVEDNIHSIGLAVEAIRGMERWGTGDMVDAAFAGFTALPEAITQLPRSWWTILGLDAPTTDQAAIKQAYKQMASKVHPDAGGSNDEFIAVQKAYEEGIGQA